MKKLTKLSFVLLAMLTVVFTSCKKEYENPPIDPLPVGEVITIGDILSMNPNTVFDGKSVCGIVTADEQSGNLYKQIFIQDRTSGKAIELMLNTSSAARIGDMVRVYLDSTIMFNMYHNLPQLVNSTDGKGFNPDKHLYIYPHNDTITPIEPTVVTISQIKSGNYTASLVKLENVEFVEQGSAFCDMGATTNRTLKDETGELLVRTSNYANFAYDMLPAGKGSLVAIASVYNSDWQMIIRSTRNKEDFDFPGGTPTPPQPAGELQHMPYTQSFATDFGTYMAYDVNGPQSWFIDYSCAVMKGYVDGENHVNEDWLISSPVAVTGVTHAKAAVNYVAQYQNSNNHDVTLQVSTDYVYGNDPTSANWTEMETTYPNTGGWQDFQTVETSLDNFIGQNITVAIKFTSSETQSRTFEVKSITVEEGEAGGDTPTPPTPGPGGGSGTADDPYNVASGIALQGQEIVGWVQGYIVGAARNGLSTVSSNDDIIWSAPFDSYTNVLIADDPTCNEVSLCVIVNLPSGKPLRSQVNLFDNPDNLGKTLAVNGKLRTYFGQAGLRDSGGTENDFVLEGGTPTPPTPGTNIFSESFANGQGSFTIQDVVLPEGLTYVWAHNSQYSCMKASAFVSGQAYATESWLVSPRIDMSNVSTARLSFDQALNYANSNGLAVMVSSNYTGDVTTADWNELDLSAWPAGTNWTFIASSADMTPYVGQTVNIAFKYTSTSSASATWEVKNIVIAE